MDYKELGFKCGIEIHQQIEGKKLFCSCPTSIRKGSHDFMIKRFLRASAGEMGEIDKAALHEQMKSKYFLYECSEETTCLVEMDEEPPHHVNKEALDAALQICTMLKCKISSRIIFMRKIVIDGSNVSGFQRTALIGVDGNIDVNGKNIRIESVCLEEESAQAIKRNDEYDIYNLSRLGIPLIEIATAPDIENPEECKEVAAKIGMILRSTGKCKRGIGSIRQDVNVSIKNGAKIEIKGFQDLRSIPKIIEYEVNRQLEETNQGKIIESHVRKAEPDMTTSYLRPTPGADRMYPETDVQHITPNLDNISKVITIEERQKAYEEKYQLNSDFSQQAVRFEDANDFSFSNLFDIYPDVGNTLIASMILNMPKEIKRKSNVDINILDHLDFILPLLDRKEISSQSVEEILTRKAKGEDLDISGYKTVSGEQVERDIKKIVEENKGAPFGALMGKAMAHFKGRVDGKIVSEMLKRYTN